eukprot:570490-Pleurochrysis_carterae.AAC.3
MAALPNSRDLQLKDVRTTVILVIDLQNFCCLPNGGAWKDTSPTKHYLESLPKVVQNGASILEAARMKGVEVTMRIEMLFSVLLQTRDAVHRSDVMYTVIESLTNDGRERSLDYKISGFNVPKGSWGAQVVEELRPAEDEIVIPKGSSSPFISTNIAYLLRNLQCEQLVVLGGLTDQCVDSTVRDACDTGFLVTLVTDACITHTAERHRSALANNGGYCRQATTASILSELRQLDSRLAGSGPPAAKPQPRFGDKSMASAAPAPVEARAADLSAESLHDSPPLAPVSVPLSAERACEARRVASRAYLRYELTDFNGRSISKVVPYRHKRSAVRMYWGAIANGGNSEVLTIPVEVKQVQPHASSALHHPMTCPSPSPFIWLLLPAELLAHPSGRSWLPERPSTPRLDYGGEMHTSDENV